VTLTFDPLTLNAMHLKMDWLISIRLATPADLFYSYFIAVVRRAAIKQKGEFVLLQLYCSFMALVRTPTIKEPTIKQKFVLFYFISVLL